MIEALKAWVLEFIGDPFWGAHAGFFQACGTVLVLVFGVIPFFNNLRKAKPWTELFMGTIRDSANMMIGLYDFLASRGTRAQGIILIFLLASALILLSGTNVTIETRIVFCLLVLFVWTVSRQVHLIAREIRALQISDRQSEIERSVGSLIERTKTIESDLSTRGESDSKGLFRLTQHVATIEIGHAELMEELREYSSRPYWLFEDDFSNVSATWKTARNTMTAVHTAEGVRLPSIGVEDLDLALITSVLPDFKDGVIECEVYLQTDSLVNLVIRGRVDLGQFFMARLDSRVWGDRILFKPNPGTWDYCNKIRQSDAHITPAEQWVTMRVIAIGGRITLYSGSRMVDQINTANIPAGIIGLFAEEGGALVRRIRVHPA